MNLRRIVLMGRITFAEGVRARFFGVLLLISLSILLTSNLFQQFDFGSSELKFVLDFGFGAVQLFGIILCVVITSQIFFNEIDQRTAISILSRDIARWEFRSIAFTKISSKIFKSAGEYTILFFSKCPVSCIQYGSATCETGPTYESGRFKMCSTCVSF